jgi:hypothetical protein
VWRSAWLFAAREAAIPRGPPRTRSQMGRESTRSWTGWCDLALRLRLRPELVKLGPEHRSPAKSRSNPSFQESSSALFYHGDPAHPGRTIDVAVEDFVESYSRSDERPAKASAQLILGSP